MSVTFRPAKKEQVGTIPNDWFFPDDFKSYAGPSLANHAATPDLTDYERDGNGAARRRYRQEDAFSSGIQGDYQEQFNEYVGLVDEGIFPAATVAAANAVYERYAMGEMLFHQKKNPAENVMVTWTNAPINNKTTGEFDQGWVEWARAKRPDLVVEPFTYLDVMAALISPDNAVIGYQTASIQGGRAIPTHLLHVSLAPALTVDNAALLKDDAERVEDVIAAAIAGLSA